MLIPWNGGGGGVGMGGGPGAIAVTPQGILANAAAQGAVGAVSAIPSIISGIANMHRDFWDGINERARISSRSNSPAYREYERGFASNFTSSSIPSRGGSFTRGSLGIYTSPRYRRYRRRRVYRVRRYRRWSRYGRKYRRYRRYRRRRP